MGSLSQHIQKQLRTLEYILGPQLWDHVITVFTFWGFTTRDIQERVKTCIKEKKVSLGETFQGQRISVNNLTSKMKRWKKWQKDSRNIWE